MRRKQLYILVMLILVIGFTGCKKKVEEIKEVIPPTLTVTPLVTPTAVPTITPTPIPEGQVRSKLSGLYVDEEIGNKRPYALMFNNISYASPQAGTEEADVMYEAIVEGGITRLLGIFEQLHDSRIGSIRSARHYYVSFADEYDAVFVHFGETTYATKKIKSLGIDNISGLTSVGDKVFYRDKSIHEPHNVFTSKERIELGMKLKNHDLEYEDNYEGHFKFYEEDTSIASKENVNKITLQFSNYTNPYFTYNNETKVYERYQFGKKHIDPNSGNQLSFKNVIVQFVKQWDIDKNDYQTMDLSDTSGKGYYITNGQKNDITWTKNESSRNMRYYDVDGNELVINQGKTFIAIFPNDRIHDVVLEQ